jgi:hypothetical protein
MFYSLLATLAAIGFFASLVCNILGWMHVNPSYGQSVFWLHIGALGLFFTLIYFGNKTMPESSRSNLAHLTAELPRWVSAGLVILFAYALLNFAWSVYCTSSYPKGKVPMWLDVRIFSGHWMLFYGLEWAGFVGLGRLSRRRVEQIPRFGIDKENRFK